MAEKSASQRQLVRLEVRYPVDPLEILHVNFIKFSHVGSDVLMDLGIIDDQALIAARQAAGESHGIEAPAYVIRRVGMTLDTLQLLRSNVEDIWNKLVAAGAILPESEE